MNFQNETLYHKDIGFPDLPMKPTWVKLKYGSHAREEALADRYGVIRLPEKVLLKRDNLIELGMVGKRVTKVVTRQIYSKTHDLIIVISAADNFVRTVWLNAVDDLHSTLDRSKYAVP